MTRVTSLPKAPSVFPLVRCPLLPVSSSSAPVVNVNARYKHVYLGKKNAMSKEAIEKELRWMGNDRVALMKRIEAKLSDDEFEEAVALVMAAEKNKIESIASWNTILGVEVKKNGPEMAFKLFNDVSLTSFPTGAGIA